MMAARIPTLHHTQPTDFNNGLASIEQRTATAKLVSPSSSSYPTMALQVKGYKALAVPLGPDEAAPFTAFVYVRQHYSKGCVWMDVGILRVLSFSVT